jgi:hypothetical protein
MTAPLTDRQLAKVVPDLRETRVALQMFRQALGSDMGRITEVVHQIGRGTAPLANAQREAAMYRARWESTVLEAKRQHAEADRLRAELADAHAALDPARHLCTTCGHGRIVHAVPEPRPCITCTCPAYAAEVSR